MPHIDEFGRAYLRLTLEIDKLMPGYVDAYYGPPEIKADVEAAPPQTPAALLDELARLAAMVPGGDAARERVLRATFRAMDCTLRTLKGEEFDYLDQVNRLYDITPWLVDTARFEAAHAELDAVLGDSGPLADRLDAFRQQYVIPTDRLPEMLDMARDVVRRRTLRLVDLVAGEQIAVELVNDQRWSAYNWYQGAGQSRIEINTDIPLNALDVLNLFAHEAYPGHHTEHQLKEKHLYEGKGYFERASALLHAPSAVIAEGIATTALEIVMPGREPHDWLVDAILPAAQLPPALPADLERIATAHKTLRYVSSNAALLLYTGQLNEDEVFDYIRTYALSTEQRARQTVRFITDPLSPAYIFTYTEGYDLIDRAAQGDKVPLFKRLLVEEMLPSDLAAIIPPEAPHAGTFRRPR